MLLLSTSTFLLCYLSFTNAFNAPITTESISARRTHTGLKNGMSTLEELGPKLNPIVGFFDPLNLAGAGFWGQVSKVEQCKKEGCSTSTSETFDDVARLTLLITVG